MHLLVIFDSGPATGHGARHNLLEMAIKIHQQLVHADEVSLSDGHWTVLAMAFHVQLDKPASGP